MTKLTIIKTNPEWLEATWIEEITTQVEAEREVQVDTEVDGEVLTATEIVKEPEDKVETKVLWCESFSGHREHIAMLEAKCIEYGTELDDEQMLIVTEVSEAYVYPTDEELQAEEINHKVQEAKNYLANTDYKMTIDYFATLSKEEQDELITKRAEAREYVRTNQ